MKKLCTIFCVITWRILHLSKSFSHAVIQIQSLHFQIHLELHFSLEKFEAFLGVLGLDKFCFYTLKILENFLLHRCKLSGWTKVLSLNPKINKTFQRGIQHTDSYQCSQTKRQPTKYWKHNPILVAHNKYGVMHF